MLLDDQDYANCIFHAKAIRKHTFKDIKYHLYILTDYLILSRNEWDANPKYIVPLTYETNIYWKLDKKTNLIKNIGFNYKNQTKFFESGTTELLSIKSLLSNKVVFRDISEIYFSIKLLGLGGSAQVHLVKDRSDNTKYASKCIDKECLQSDGGLIALYNEINCMKDLDHENIIKLKEIYEGGKSFYLIVQFMRGNSLAHLIKTTKTSGQFFTFQKIKEIMHNILEGVFYLHQQNIMHRDLKPENIMFNQVDNLSSLKLVDFGLATHLNCEKFIFPKCGTPGYTAPEIIVYKEYMEKYGLVCDIFSVGVIMYKLITLKDLFPGHDLLEIMKQNKKCQLNLNILALYKTPESALNLIQKMLQSNPQKRITAKQALKHPFFTDSYECHGNNVEEIQVQKKKKFFQDHKRINQIKHLLKTADIKLDSLKKIILNDSDVIADEGSPYAQIPLKFTNLKRNFMLGSFMIKQDLFRQKQVNTKKKMFKKFQTQDFDNNQTLKKNQYKYQPTLIIGKELAEVY